MICKKTYRFQTNILDSKYNVKEPELYMFIFYFYLKSQEWVGVIKGGLGHVRMDIIFNFFKQVNKQKQKAERNWNNFLNMRAEKN